MANNQQAVCPVCGLILDGDKCPVVGLDGLRLSGGMFAWTKIDAAMKHARHDALEEAEGICEGRAREHNQTFLFAQRNNPRIRDDESMWKHNEAQRLADAIRRLKEGK